MDRLYADEDFDHAVVRGLRQLGHGILTVQEAGRANQAVPDMDVLADATILGRAVPTFNRRDFIRLHRQSTAHAGIVVCTRDEAGEALARRIDQALSDLDDLRGQLIRVNRP
jgi:hypothetical protein